MANDVRSKIIFVFLDGLGLGRGDGQNPVYVFKLLERLAGERLVNGLSIESDSLVVKGIDACLGVPGLPQSATGQTALFTGVNAARLIGFHLPAYPNAELRSVIRESNIFTETLRMGRKATFANAYRKEYFDSVAAGKRSHSVTTHCCLYAGVPLRNMESYDRHEALCWDITGKYAGQRTKAKIAEITPEQAGTVVAGLSGGFDLVVFESFLPDLIGHSRDMERAGEFCGVFDRFLTAVIGGIDKRTTVVVSSDHGNFEDLSTGSHTLNPAVLFAFGADARRFFKATSITHVPAIIVSILNSGGSSREPATNNYTPPEEPVILKGIP